jgi:calnexin
MGHRSRANIAVAAANPAQTPFTIMFGPDKCGSTNKVHFFRHKNPITGEWEEKHLVNPPAPKITKTTALYTLIVK